MRTLPTLTLMFAAFLAAFCLPTTAQTADLQAAVDAAVDRVKPSLVRIHVVSTHYMGGREIKFQSSGSGAIITPEGHVITNHHVAGHATRLLCTMSDKREIDAVLIGTDALTDIAVIQLTPGTGETFPTVDFADSDAVRVGDHVLAMGSPLSISQSVTLGIMSNTEMVLPRRMSFGGFQLDGEDVGALVRWFAHDAVIYPGNSGGPLVDLSGDIVGINEISFGLGGAIPGNLAKQVADQLIANGVVSRGWLGLNVQPLLKHGFRERGVLVTGVFEDSPADQAGIQSGDILVSLDGKPVHVRYDEQLPEFNYLESMLPIGQAVDAVILRDATEQTLSIAAAPREKVLPPEHEVKEWGITASDLSLILAKELKRDNRDGVLVTSVRPGGPAGDAKPPIQPDDVIVAVGDEMISSYDDLLRVTKAIAKDAEEPVPTIATFERKAGSYITVVDVGISELQDPGLEVRKAWLPVGTQVITRDVAELLGDTRLKGFRVSQVYDPADGTENPLEIGDLILAVDGERLTASAPEHYEELPTLIRSYKIGAETELLIQRGGDQSTVVATLQESPKLDREMRKYRDDNFEFTVRDVTFFDKADEQLEDETRGVLIEEVASGGWAALGMLQTGDLLLSIDGREMPNIDAVREAMENIATNKPDAIVMKVLRGIYTVFVELEPKWTDEA